MTVKSEYTYPDRIIIGTRGSPLALVQANIVKSQIEALGQNIAVEIAVIKTSGDWKPADGEKPLDANAGGKAQFAKEIEEALLEGAIDIAVHSMKDMEATLPDGLVIPYMLPREDVRDVFLSNKSQNIEDLPKGSVVGTVSVRRQAFLLSMRPDLTVVPIRGNVETRLTKLNGGMVDATFLALAGLKRMGLDMHATDIIPVHDMLPAVGQGAVGIEMRSNGCHSLSFISQISCSETVFCVSVEREVMRGLGGSCHTPVGVYARLKEGVVHLDVKIVSSEGKQYWEDAATFSYEDLNAAKQEAYDIGKRLRSEIPEGVL